MGSLPRPAAVRASQLSHGLHTHALPSMDRVPGLPQAGQSTAPPAALDAAATSATAAGCGTAASCFSAHWKNVHCFFTPAHR